MADDILDGVEFGRDGQGDDDAPGSIQEVIERTEMAKTGGVKSTSFSLPTELHKRLNRYVKLKQADGGDITMSSIVTTALDKHLRKLEKKQAAAASTS